MRQTRSSLLATCVLVSIFSSANSLAAAEDDPAALTLYRERCANCHDGGAVRAPDRTAMKLLAPDRVRAALTTGSMVEQARGLVARDLDLLVAYLSGPAAQTVAAETTPRCAAPPPAL